MLVNILIKTLLIKFNMPISFTSDRESLFISYFQSYFCYYLKIHLKYSTTFYFQTNSQTKPQNQMLKQYLCNYVNYQQNNQIYQLLLVKYAYSNSIYAIMQQSFFQAMFEEKMRYENIIQDDKDIEIFLAQDQAFNVASIKVKLEVQVKKAIKTQIKYYNTKYQQQKYNVEDKIFFNSQNIKSIRFFKEIRSQVPQSLQNYCTNRQIGLLIVTFKQHEDT